MESDDMIALANLGKWPKMGDNYKLIKLIRELKSRSTSREIDPEKPVTYDHNRLREYDIESKP